MSTRFDPNLIKEAPTSTKSNSSDNPSDELFNLRHRITKLEDENAKLKAEISVESQKARLMIPYANKVFCFCCFYSIFAFVILFLDGYEINHFKLEASTLNFIAGSTLASVIGLLTIIVSGLFASK